MVEVGLERPDPELRQTDAHEFVLLKGFCYRVPRGDPESGTVYVIPGDNAPDRVRSTRRSTTTDDPARTAIIPPTDGGGATDLASVPSFMWWLVASYGNHTRAALLHDALYVDEGEEAPVPHATADRLFLTALREPGQKTGVFRHWLMWTAVSAFGNMRRSLGFLFCLHVLIVWSLTIAAVAWAWGPSLWQMSWAWWDVLAAVAAVPVFLGLLGSFWRAGVDLTGGWLSPTLVLAGVILLPLWRLWPEPFKLEGSAFTLVFAAAVLMPVGLAWGKAVDPTLRMWLWPTALIGLPIALIPVGLIVFVLVLVWFIDFGAALAASRRRGPDGVRRQFQRPTLKPYRLRI